MPAPSPAPTAPRLVEQVTGAVERRLPLSWRLRRRYRRRHGRRLSLSHPRTFTEKVHWRMLRDRRGLIAGTCDKLEMKRIAQAAGVPGLKVPATHWAGTDLAELAGLDLPERWVLKPNHRYGLVHLGHGRPDVAALQELTTGWLDEPQSALGEWAYSQARRCFVVEEMISTEPLDDFKFFVFDGQPRLIGMHTGRTAGRHRNRVYSPDWEPVGVPAARPAAEVAPRPERLEEMLAAAAALGRSFDFIRVDLYQVGGQVWFGELTPYPGSGMSRLQPPELDVELGSYWRLPLDR